MFLGDGWEGWGVVRRMAADLLGLRVEVTRGALDGEEGWWVSMHRRAGARAAAMVWVPQRGRVRFVARGAGGERAGESEES
jgi:hypothetical protein